MLFRPRLEIQEVRPDAGCAGGARRAHDFRQQLRLVAQPGQDRRHPDAGLHAGLDELGQRTEALAGRSGARLRPPPDLHVERRDRERHAHVCALRRLDEHVEVAHDHRPARDDRERVRRGGEHLEAGAGQLVAALGRLVRIGGGADRDPFALPRRPGELAPQHLARRSSSRGCSPRSARPTAGRRAARMRGRNRRCSGGRSPCTG